MYIHVNKKKMKKLAAGALATALALCGAGVTVKMAGGGSLKGKTGQNSVNTSIPESGCVNWGLSFQKEGEAPAGSAGREELEAYNAFCCGDPEEKAIYLTFDAGFENGNTEKILDILKKEEVQAAFFVVGTYIRDNPKIVKRMSSEGHIVGNHTMNHPDMTKKNTEEFRAELSAVEELYKEATGKELDRFYRPPMGKFNGGNLSAAKELGYTTLLWSLAYVDWIEDKQPTREEALEKLTHRIHNGAVVLLHSTSKTNGKYLGEFIRRWKEMGYEFRTLNRLSQEAGSTGSACGQTQGVYG